MTKQWERPEITPTFAFVDDRQPGEEWPIKSGRYEVIGRVGKGTWGTVYAARDSTAGDLVALKVLTPTGLAQRQMEARGTTTEEIARREGRQLVAASHVVPRTIEVDDSGMQFIKMPIYPRTLADAIKDNDRENRLRVGDGLTLGQATGYLQGIALGVEEMQTRYDLIHPDLSPNNVVLDGEDRALLTDLGSATVATVEGDPQVRDNMGSIFTRAYECFEAGSHPSRASNSWAVGALAYRLFTGNYPHESGLENAIDPAKYMGDLDFESARAIVLGRDFSKVPRPFRNFVASCLSYHPDLRPKDGAALVKELNKAISRSKPGAMAKRFGIAAAVLGTAASLGGALWYAVSSGQDAQKSQEQLVFEKRTQVVREYLGERSKPTWQIEMDGWELNDWISKLGDERTGIAAFLDANVVYEAVQRTGGRTDWESLVPKIREIDDEFYAKVTSCTDGEYMDRWMYQVRGNGAEKVNERWSEARQVYETKKRIEEDEKKATWGSGIIGPVNANQFRKSTSQPSQEHYNFTGQPPKNP